MCCHTSKQQPFLYLKKLSEEQELLTDGINIRYTPSGSHFNHSYSLKNIVQKMPNLSQGILDDFLPFSPLGAIEEAPEEATLHDFRS